MTADGFSELPGILVAYVARRRSNQPGHRVPFHKLRHVKLQQCILAAEHKLGQRLGQFRLAHSGGAKEDEGADGPAGVLQPGPRPTYRLSDRRDSLVLADNAPMKCFFHVQQPLRLATAQLGKRDARPH